MSVIRTLIGNVKGPAGATGATGATGAAGANGADGAAATVSVGTVSTTAYGNPASVINSGTTSAAVLDFVIPQGQPGEEVTDMSGLTLGTMTTQTAQYPTPQIGDNGATLWGKVVKYFSDLRTLIGTKLNTSNVVNNFTTTESGYALDARAGKTLSDSLTNLFVRKTYTYTIPSLAAYPQSGCAITVTGEDLNVSTPTGYTPIAYNRLILGSDNCRTRIVNLTGTGTGTVLRVINDSTTPLTDVPVTIIMIYIPTACLTNLD